MEEARAVLERLERIEETSNRDELIAELRELVREVEAWVRAEAAMIPA
jgi:triphosphoribosyl-dephospho-CoA synthetase